MFHVLDLLEKAAKDAPHNGLTFYSKPTSPTPFKVTYSELLSNVKVSDLQGSNNLH